MKDILQIIGWLLFGGIIGAGLILGAMYLVSGDSDSIRRAKFMPLCAVSGFSPSQCQFLFAMSGGAMPVPATRHD